MILAVLAAILAAADGPRHASSEIAPEGDLEGHWEADLDGDGLGDLLLGVWSRQGGREILVHLQDREGRFRPAPDRRVALKPDIVAFAVADVREEPGAELLLFTPSSCFGLSTTKEGYGGNARRLFECQPIWSVADPKRVLRAGTVTDLDGDGRPEVLVPRAGDFAVFAGDGREGFSLRCAIPLPIPGADREPPPRRGARALRLGQGGASVEKEDPVLLVEAWDPADRPTTTFLAAERWIRRPWLGDVDGDGRPDLLCLGPDGKELRVHRQGTDGKFPEQPGWTGRIEEARTILPRDLDGDGRIDLAAAGSKGDDETDLRFFLNRGGSFRLDAPDGVLKFSGYGVTPHLADLDGDGLIDLAVSSLSLSAEDLLKGGKVVRTLVLFGREPGGLFGRRPAYRVDESFSAADVKALSQPVNLDADLLGAGGRQVLHVDREGAVVARRIDRSLRIQEEPAWRFVPSRAVTGIEVLSLNGDSRSDLVLLHIRSLTVLVSR